MTKKLKPAKPTRKSTLFIDSTDMHEIKFAAKGTVNKAAAVAVDSHSSHQVLEQLQKFLKKLPVKDLSRELEKIVVCKGPGSYTGTRIGVAHALALGFAWNVKVVALEKLKFEKLVSMK